MNVDRLKAISGASIGAVIAWVVNANWEPFVRVMTGLSLPVYSFLLALAAGMAAWAGLFLHPGVCSRQPHNCADGAAVLIGMGGYMLQVLAAGGSHTGWEKTLLPGFVVGMLAMLLSRQIWSVGAKPKEPQP